MAANKRSTTTGIHHGKNASGLCMSVLTRALELLLGGDGHLYGGLSLHFARYVLDVRYCCGWLVDGHWHGCGDWCGHSDDDVECAASVLAVAATETAVLAAALYDGGWAQGARRQQRESSA